MAEKLNGNHRNAIKVENIGRTQVGHIPKTIAAKLAPLMDRKEITVEGVMLEGNRECPPLSAGKSS